MSLVEPIWPMVGVDLDEEGDYCAAIAHFCSDPGGTGMVVLYFLEGRIVAGEATRMGTSPPASQPHPLHLRILWR